MNDGHDKLHPVRLNDLFIRAETDLASAHIILYILLF